MSEQMTELEIEERVQRAQELFRQGFNCAQAVFASCADLFDIRDEALALRMAASFGGGIGRMRQTCGAACGMFMLEGLHSGSAVAGDREGKAANYEHVQQLAAAFKQQNGSLVCAELLAGTATAPLDGPMPEERTDAYYKKRPCIEMVSSAVRIFLENLT